MAGEQDGAPETEQAAADLSGTQAAPVAQAASGPKVLGRHRRHQFPAREHLVKVMYATDERRAVEQAAEVRGLRTSSYVGMAALEMAQSLLEGCRAGDAPPEAGAGGRRRAREDQELLAELIQARLALRRFGVNLNQAVAAINSGAPVPVWLEQAVAGGDRAVARVDEAAAAVARRFG